MPVSRHTLWAIALITLLSACSPPPSPAVRAFGDNDNWIVLEDMVYVIGHTKDPIIVPKGFVTDYASIPWFLWSLGLSPHGQYSRAAVVHDYLYWVQSCRRDQADRLLLIAMKESQVGAIVETIVFLGVRSFGWLAWSKNADERKAGLPRIVLDQNVLVENPNIHWQTYREKAPKDPPFPANPDYCKYGDSSAVP